MANLLSQYYYAQGQKPLLKSMYDDGSSNLYDASGMFPNQVFDLPDGSVFDPYAEALQAQTASNHPGGYNDPYPQPGYAAPGTPSAGSGAYPYPIGLPGGPYTPPAPPAPAPAPAPAPPVAAPIAAPPPAPPTPPAPAPAPAPTPPAPPPGGGTPVPTPPASTAPGGGDQDFLRKKGLYDYAGNPQGAMLNALKDQGWSTYNNPYANQMMQLANGLALSFMGQRAGGSANQGDVQASYGDFGDFLHKALGGGQAFNTVASARSMMPNIINQIRGFDQGAASGGQDFINNSNPFVQALSAMFGAGSGKGASDASASLYSPFMSSNIQQAYGGLVNNAFSNAQRGFLAGGDLQHPTYGGNDWWKYIFGQ